MFSRTIARVARSSPAAARLPLHAVHARRTILAAPRLLASTRVQAVAAPRRAYSTGKSPADELIEQITEQYSTARDEFEIAAEETEKKTVYAADDRAAAAEEMTALKELYEGALRDSAPEVAAEVKSRVGQRIRELDEALKGLEARALEE